MPISRRRLPRTPAVLWSVLLAIVGGASGCGGRPAAAPVAVTPPILDGHVRPPSNDPPPPTREFRAAWVATVDNIDWPTKPGLTTAQQQAEALAILDKASELRLNAIILQVRPTADALYDSKLEPWSAFLTGAQGKAPDPYYDPLTFWVAEAHKRGIELHAWFNPFRTRHGGKPVPAADTHVSRAHPEWVREYGSVAVTDPGDPAAVEHSVKVFMDVVDRYDIDGVHIDDYFYPYPEKNPDGPGERPFPDDATYAKYRQGGGKLARPDWRRQNVTDWVRAVYDGIKKRKPAVKFGISPFGIPRPGLDGIGYVSGFDQYEQLYADTAEWLRNGWCDYFVPQLYWKISSPQQPYLGLLQWWAAHNPKGRHLYAGLYTSRVRTGGDKGWGPDELLGQVMLTRLTAGAHGEVHFSMAALSKNWKDVASLLRDGPYAEPALAPAAPWLDAVPPPAPAAVTVAPLTAAAAEATQPTTAPATATAPATSPAAGGGRRARGGVRVAWQVPNVTRGAKGGPPWVWAVQYKVGETWKLAVVPGDRTEVTIEPGKGSGGSAVAVSHVFVAAVDRCGNLSRRVAASEANPAVADAGSVPRR